MTHMPDDLLAHALSVKGFMPEAEGALLHETAVATMRGGPALEIGTYCGKSAIWLGAAARATGSTVFTLDHHRGSEENQVGWEHHDAELVDPEFGQMDSLPTFRKHDRARRARGRGGRHRRSLHSPSRATGALPCRCCSSTGATPRCTRRTTTPASPAGSAPDGALVIHDVFERAEDGGGQAPYHVWKSAVDSRTFTPVKTVGSMRVLIRTSGAAGDNVGCYAGSGPPRRNSRTPGRSPGSARQACRRA